MRTVLIGVACVVFVAVTVTVYDVLVAINSPSFLSRGYSPVIAEPYYPEVVRIIRADANFRKAFGGPFVVDDGGVHCSSIHDDAVERRATCTIPVHIPTTPGIVSVRIVYREQRLHLEASLGIGTRTYEQASTM